MIRHHRHVYALTLTVRSPVVTQAHAAPRIGIDLGTARDAAGDPVLPASHVKGHLREAFAALAECAQSGVDTALLKDWFGWPSPDGTNDPGRGRLIFGDLAAPNLPDCAQEAVRVEIDDQAGAVKQGMLAFIELIAPPGAPISFEGRLIAWLTKEEEAGFEDRIRRALDLVLAVGSNKTAGFGELIHDQCTFRRINIDRPAPTIPNGDVLAVDVVFDRPVLFDVRRESDNVLLGASVAPGAVIKGALARRLTLEGMDPTVGGSDWHDTLSRITVSHAFPLDTEGRELDIPLPLSLMGGNDPLRILCGFAHEAPLIEGRAAKSIDDFKPGAYDHARALFGRAHESLDERRLPQSHIKVNARHGIAEDEALFVVAPVSHLRLDGAPRRWRFTLARPDELPPERFRTAVERICAGLDWVGASAAAMTVETVEAVSPDAPVAYDAARDTWLVTLKTPALMLDAVGFLGAAPFDADPAKRLRDAFAAYWSDHGLDLIDYFAEMRLAGGHAALRTEEARAGGYRPFLLTEAGSSFLLRGDAASFLKRALRFGLPVLKRDPPLTWRETTYLPQNGYGAILIEPHRHLDLGDGL